MEGELLRLEEVVRQVVRLVPQVPPRRRVAEEVEPVVVPLHRPEGQLQEDSPRFRKQVAEHPVDLSFLLPLPRRGDHTRGGRGVGPVWSRGVP